MLQDPTTPTSHIELLTSVLSSDEALYSLTHPENPFPAPDGSSKTKFESQTSAIVTSTANSKFPSIADLKKEALALSKTLNIQELSALRLVILEYESRDENAIVKSTFTPQIAEMEGLWKESTLKISDLKSDEELEKEANTRRLGIYLMEKRYVVVAATFLIRATLSAEGSNSDAWKPLGQKVLDALIGNDKGYSTLKALAEGLRGRIYSENSNVPAWIKEQSEQHGEEVLFEWEKQFLTESIHLLQLIFILTYRPIFPSAKVVSLWFALMQDSRFLTEITGINYIAAPDIQRLYSYLQPLACLISLALISLPTVSEDYLRQWQGVQENDQALYIESSTTTSLITKTLLETPHDNFVSIVSFAWCIVIDRLRTNSEENQRMIEYRQTSEEMLDSNQYFDSIDKVPSAALVRILEGLGSEGKASINNLAADSVRYMWKAIIALATPNPAGFSLVAEDDGERMKETVSSLVQEAILYVAYDSSMLAASILLHDCSATVESLVGTFQPARYKMPSYISRFWSSSAAKRKILDPVRLRFPYEPEPFLQVAKALSADDALVQSFLREISTFTHVLPRWFRDYEIDCEDPFIIQLAAPLVLLEPRQEGKLSDESSAIELKVGTIGRIISEGASNQVIKWDFQYSPLALLGRILEIKLGNRPEYGGFAPGMGERIWDRDLCTDIVQIFVSLIRTRISSGITKETVDDIEALLGEASDVVSTNKDVISIILELLEEGLQEAQLDATRNTDFIQAATTFATLLARVLPQRIWPFIARSSLLERHGRGGALPAILSAIEVVKGDYDFTIAGLDLFDSLVEEVLHTCVSAVTISSPKVKTPQRSLMALSGSVSASSKRGNGTGVSKSVQKDIIAEFTRWAVALFQSYRGWKYNSLSQRHEIGKNPDIHYLSIRR